uniref:Uncharacterized protein n=1 Tax=Ciona intestinalis TaxID=7719 RepID=F7AMD1_CIOIN
MRFGKVADDVAITGNGMKLRRTSTFQWKMSCGIYKLKKRKQIVVKEAVARQQ